MSAWKSGSWRTRADLEVCATHHGLSVTVVVEVRLPNVALMVTVSVAEIVPNVTVKLASVVPAGIIILVGTGKLVLSEEESETVVSPVGAATVRTTVHVEVFPEFNVLELQAIEDSTGVAKTGTVTTLLRKLFCAIYNSALGSVVNDEDKFKYTW